LKLAQASESVGKLIKDLREPRPGGNPCIPWLGDIAVKEKVIRMCAEGQIAINVRGMELLQANPGEETEFAWTRMKGRLGSGKHLDETIMLVPDATSVSGGKSQATSPDSSTGTTTQPDQVTEPAEEETNVSGTTNGGLPNNPFDASKTPKPTTLRPCSSTPTSGLNLLGQVESWGIGPATSVNNVALKIGKMTGAQLQALIKHLPDGVTYALALDKEEGK
jgi:hypothetical protein